MESPDGNELYLEFDYTYATSSFMPLKVNYDNKNYDAKLEWYTKGVEEMTVRSF